jgi:polyphosphate kinase
MDLKQPDLYLNRELSQLEFISRVLLQAEDEQVPLLERLRFLCISSTILDEFFETRVAGLRQMAEVGSLQTGPDNLSSQDALKAIRVRARALVCGQYRILNEVVLPSLAAQGIRAVRRSDWTERQESWLRAYFHHELQPILSPLGLDPAHPFPRVLNKSLNFIVSLTGKDAFGRKSGLAVVQVPRALPRIVQLPPDETGSGPHEFVFLSSIIHAYADDLFYGLDVTGSYQFRVTRNSDLFVDEEEVDDLLRAVEGELFSRHYGDSVRLEVASNCPEELVDFLLEQFRLGRDDLYLVDGPVNLNRLTGIVEMTDRPELTYPSFTPARPASLAPGADFFEVLRNGDILLHHPYESFAPVVEFVRQVAADSQVLAVKQTLYRTGSDSAIVDALVAAARSGKEVTVVIELRARFDEEANVALATRLHEAGAHVVYGIVGHKTHAKMLLVTRREGKKLINYVHLGTGNYHSRTARVYTDYGLLTSDPAICGDVHRVFQQLTSLSKVVKLDCLLQSPFTLHKALLKKIQREIEHAAAGRPARIIIKINALIEPQLIQALYAASGAGVEIDLVVRGVCALRPGIPGVSERIRVRSVVGRLLEHTRVYYFENGGDTEVWCSSADWMERNMFRRVEVAFPILKPRLAKRVYRDLLCYLKDNTQAWILQPDGSYERAEPAPGAARFSAQQALLDALAEQS